MENTPITTTEEVAAQNQAAATSEPDAVADAPADETEAA